MADTKIASLTDGLTTSATDRIPVAISPYGSGNNAYITPSYLKTFMVTGGTVTSSTPVFDMTQTWNSGAVTFSGLKLNVTDTASASGSLLMDLQVGGSSKASVTKSGDLTVTTVTLSSGLGGVSSSGGPWAASTGRFAFGGNFAGPFLQYDGNSATLGLRDSTNAQTFNIYASSTSSNSNFQCLKLSAGVTPNMAVVAADNLGTGAAMGLQFGVSLTTGGGTTNIVNINTSGHLLWNTSNTYDIGANGANAPRRIYAASAIVCDVFRMTFLNNGDNSKTILTMTNGSSNVIFANAATSPLFQFAGSTSSFPALKRSTTSLQARLADDSAFAAIQGKITTDTAYTATPPTCTGYITIYDSTGTPYQVMVGT